MYGQPKFRLIVYAGWQVGVAVCSQLFPNTASNLPAARYTAVTPLATPYLSSLYTAVFWIQPCQIRPAPKGPNIDNNFVGDKDDVDLVGDLIFQATCKSGTRKEMTGVEFLLLETPCPLVGLSETFFTPSNAHHISATKREKKPDFWGLFGFSKKIAF